VLTAVVTFSGATFDVALSGAPFVGSEEGVEAEGPESDLNPIFPELKEVVAEQTLELRLLKKSMIGDGGEDE